MPRKIVILTVVILLLLGFGIFFAMNQSTDKASNSTDTAPQSSTGATDTTPPPAASSPQTATGQDPACPVSDSPEITYSGGNFSPACVTVKAGTAVKWKNESDAQIQVGADPHPTHTGNREVSGGAFTLDIAAGGTATSTLTTLGSHGFHNHLNPSAQGKIVVQ
jgi:plastocyanin